jgi:hypothetical protein
MNLEQYCGKTVSILASNGKTFEGFVDDFFFADDNENGMDSIVIKTNNNKFIEFPEDDILKIEII